MKIIKIANADIPVKFGMFVLGTFLRERNLKLSDLSQLGDDLLFALELAFAGVQAGYKQQGEKCPYTLEKFCDLVDQDKGGINRITDLISSEISVPVDEETKNEVAEAVN
jgi:hypothetical protein